MHRVRSILRQVLEYLCSQLPFKLVMKIVKVLLESQGFGSGARVSTSGEIKAAHSFLYKCAFKNPVIFDVGANRGEYCEGILSEFPKSQIYAFEPSTLMSEALKKRFTATKQVSVCSYGLGDKTQEMSLYKESADARISSLTKLGVTDDQYTEKVDIRKLDEVVLQLDVDVIHLLKIDVEGHELDVIRGADKMIVSGRVKIIQFELGGSSIDTHTTFKDIYDYLIDCQFTIYLIQRRGTQEITSYNYLYEQYSTTNFVAVHRSTKIEH